MAEGLAATLITRGSTAARQLAQSDTQTLLPPQPIVKTAVIQWSFTIMHYSLPSLIIFIRTKLII